MRPRDVPPRQKEAAIAREGIARLIKNQSYRVREDNTDKTQVEIRSLHHV